MIDIDKVVKTINSGYSLDFEFGKYSKIYMHTTENIKDFIRCFDLKNKDVFTVAGSGDQTLNAYSCGAKSVDIFDINPLTKCGVDLKISGAKALTYEEFIHFFFSEFSEYFSEHLYERIYPYLESDTKILFDTLFNKVGVKKALKGLYYQLNPTLEKMKRMNLYLDEYYYYLLKNNLKDKKVGFIEESITDIDKRLNKKYDMMMFSNISDSLNIIYGENSLEFFKELITSLIEYLNFYGTIEVGYIYGCYSKMEVTNDFINKNKREKVFTTDEYHTMLVNSYDGYFQKDRVVYYTKTK